MKKEWRLVVINTLYEQQVMDEMNRLLNAGWEYVDNIVLSHNKTLLIFKHDAVRNPILPNV